MSLKPGTRIGVYEVTALLGAGGMGEVYRATDARLRRDVALKVLPDLFASDPERLARFEREAQLLASLNHPHIAAIHGFEHADAHPPSGDTSSAAALLVRALVLELVEGRRWPNVSPRDRFQSVRPCSSLGRLPRPSKPHTSKASSTVT